MNMESICIVGGIKSEPSLIEYVPPKEEGSIEITFSDIGSGEDEPKKEIVNEPASNWENHMISDKKEADKDKETRDVFRYVGYDAGNSNQEEEKCIFNFTKNEHLFVCTKENRQDHDKSKTANRLLPDEITDVAVPEIKRRKRQYVYLPQSKVNLNMARCSENLFSGEYQKTDDCYRCAHCGSQYYTIKTIRQHIIENHRETELKQCPHCDVKTKVLQFHLKSHRGKGRTDNHRSGSAQEAPNKSKASGKSRTGKRKVDFRAALYSEDLSYGEYYANSGVGCCLHCDFRDSLEGIKTHIITTHRKTEVKQCPLCKIGTKVLTYHLRSVHNCTPNQAPSLLAEYAAISKTNELEKKPLIENGLVIAETQITDEPPVIRMTKKSRHKIDLNLALYSEDLSHLEYKKMNFDYCCLHCKHRAYSLADMKTHVIENHRKTELKQCPHCDVQTRVLKYHLRTHEKASLEYKCKECNYEAINISKLNRHVRVHHEDRIMMQCNFCQKIYQSKIHLVSHIRRFHSGTDRKFSCKYCNYTSKFKTSVDTHMERHGAQDEPKTVLKCEQCNYQTKFRVLFNSHKHRMHKSFVCDQCGAKLSTKQSLKLHLLLHKDKLEDEDLPIRCNLCNYKTNRHYNLKIHSLKHKRPGDEEFFYCYHCNFKANRKDNLKTHIFKHFQKEEVVFQCFICDFTATKKHALIRHIDEHSRNE